MSVKLTGTAAAIIATCNFFGRGGVRVNDLQQFLLEIIESGVAK